MGLFCGKRCQARKDKRLELKFETKKLRITEKTERVGSRQEAKMVAYANGIDPKASMWNAIGGIGTAAANAFGKNPGGSAFRPSPVGTRTAQDGQAGSMLMSESVKGVPNWAWLAGVGLLLIMKRR